LYDALLIEVPPASTTFLAYRRPLETHSGWDFTMNIYTRAVTSKKRRAQTKVVEMILQEGNKAVATKGVA
jgi:hypothetical protein